MQRNRPLAPLTSLKVGGPAQFFAEPRDRDELARLVRCCRQNEIPFRVLGGGTNLLVRDEGVRGVVARLRPDVFGGIDVQGTAVRAGAAALLSELISESVRAGLTGLEGLVGIPGTVGGAVRGNAGGRSGDIGEHVRKVTVLTADGEVDELDEDDVQFGYRSCSIKDPVILDVVVELSQDDPERITRRVKKQWILKKSSQPLGSQSAGCIFKNPRGTSAGELIEQAGLVGRRVGGAEVSERHANFIVTHEGATASDVLQLAEQIREEVARQFGIELEYEIDIW